MVAGGIALQRLRELPAVVDQHCAETNHPFVKVRQQLQEIRPLLTVPQNAGLVVIEPVVLRQSGRVSRPQLAECGVHEAPPGGGPLPDQIQVVRAEEYGVVYLTQGGAVFGRHLTRVRNSRSRAEIPASSTAAGASKAIISRSVLARGDFPQER